ncbi:Cell division protein ZapE [BD1-7 clade bacterium]|uniref:Cell division protein ZapE n=1 Tax=BD1-7 clade bacterium TaxID=2029982 RepID=A0A5S9Q9Y6_9GAMM|nr:Cell division protein ZapE [BD1-7 clade bacterium]CAA0115426.1 Cell division protein ZapE [BD1-7 clade bacterium]
MTTPLSRYQDDLKRDDFQFDAAQQHAVEKLNAVFEALVAEGDQQGSPTSLGLFGKLKSRITKPDSVAPVRGLYFWGGVGRGKTYLMDVFYECLPFERKWRSHFHRFMQYVHEELRALDGEKNPLDIVARHIADKARVICFDEFFVTDITDAMILGGLFEKLFDMGVTLIATSNIVPDRLYENGLQRARFLPAIEQLKIHCEVVNVDGGVDYRLRALRQAELYYCPLDVGAQKSLEQSWASLVHDQCNADLDIEINGRMIPAQRESDGIAWFDFDALCDGPRSQNDYIELARIYHTVLLSNIPELGLGRDDQTRRFINLIDEFYDRHVKLIVSAEKSIDTIYSGGNLAFEIERTQSRLLEMQSHEYLGLEHKP